MLYVNDKVKVTKEAREDTYDKAWWTDKELIITDVTKDDTVTEYDETLYNFITVDGEDVPCSLYEYELELVEKNIPQEMVERLETKYALVDYYVDSNIDDIGEVNFLENICEDYYRGCSDLQNIIEENMYSFFEYSLSDKLEFSIHIEDYINDFIRSCGVSNFRQCLDGGIREYLFAQFFSNALNVYSNIIFMKINDEIENIGEYKDEMLSKPNTIFLNLDVLELEDAVSDFVNSFGYENTIYDKDVDNLYEEFCSFLSDKIED